MDIQLKKGLLDIVVLSSLLKYDSYGYKIIQDVSSVIEISESTLYPILRRLEKIKHLDTYTAEHNGRLRKYYKITELGRAKTTEFLQDWEKMEKIYGYILSNISCE